MLLPSYRIASNGGCVVRCGAGAADKCGFGVYLSPAQAGRGDGLPRQKYRPAAAAVGTGPLVETLAVLLFQGSARTGNRAGVLHLGARMSNVVLINGAATMDPSAPNEAVVEFLEDMLERARSGEVQGVSGAYVNADDSAGSFHFGYISPAQVGSMVLAQKRMAEALDD